jgi:hypothetical protein
VVGGRNKAATKSCPGVTRPTQSKFLSMVCDYYLCFFLSLKRQHAYYFLMLLPFYTFRLATCYYVN